MGRKMETSLVHLPSRTSVMLQWPIRYACMAVVSQVVVEVVLVPTVPLTGQDNCSHAVQSQAQLEHH